MKIKLGKFKAAIAALSRDELEALALGVSISIYGSSYTEGDDELTPEEIAALELKDGDLFFDSEKEWSGDTLPDVAEDLENAGLTPEKIATFEPPAFEPYAVELVTVLGAPRDLKVGDRGKCVAVNSDASKHLVEVGGHSMWFASGWIRRVK